MDVYASQKIKAIVKGVGSLILILFYSSLVDFYYIGPYIHNILSQLKFLVKSVKAISINAKLVHKIFLDINTMMLDAMIFFNGFNRVVIKDVKKHLSGDVIINERLFLFLRGVKNGEEIINMTRDNSGSKKYNELIESGKIKPKVKSDVRIREPKKYGDEVKLEKNEGGLIKFLSFKRAAKRKVFLGKDLNIREYKEYQDTYTKTIEIFKSLESGPISSDKKEEEKGDNNILEVFDFINNVTNTDTDNEAKLKKELSFWDNDDDQNKNQNQNEDMGLTFGFDFDFGEKDKNKKEGGKNEKKEENKVEDIFDFGNDQPNTNKDKNNKNENKKEKKMMGDLTFLIIIKKKKKKKLINLINLVM